MSLKLDRVDPLTDADRRWQRQLEQLQLQALPTVRNSAERWAAGSAAMLAGLGLTAVLANPDQLFEISSPWHEIGRVAFSIAVPAGFLALWFANIAAQATALGLRAPSGPELRRVSGPAVEKAQLRLRVSRVCTAIALGGVLVAGLCALWGPRPAAAELECQRLSDELRRPQAKQSGVRCRLVKEVSLATSDRGAER